ncbi:MAG: tetratricopeptide repeat protein [Gemmataceae bacterium]
MAEGHYLLGRIAEDMNQLDEAIASYREAVRTHGQLDEAGSRYRIALARAMLKQQPPAEPARSRSRRPRAPARRQRRRAAGGRRDARRADGADAAGRGAG